MFSFTRTNSNLPHLLRFLLGYFVLPNLPFWVAAHYLGISRRGYVDIDYVVCGIASLFLGPALVIAGLSLSCLLDLFCILAAFYYFTQRDFLASAIYLGELPWRTITLLALAVSTGVIAWSTLIFKIAGGKRQLPRSFGPGMSFAATFKDKRTAVAVSVIVILALAGIQGVIGSLRPSTTPDSRPAKNLINAAAIPFARAALQEHHFRPVRGAPRSVESATSLLLHELRTDVAGASIGAPNHNIVLILVESYGLMLDAKAAARLASPYRDPQLAARYSITTGQVPFHGGTVPGEFRELCGLGMGVGEYPDALQCLPALLNRRGYRSTAFHGFSSHMFDRETWYPQIGFNESHFLEEMMQDSAMQRCPGFFPGICDSDIARRIGDQLVGDPGKLQFVYWVTLNSHLPVDRSSAASTEMGCGTDTALVTDVDVCTWMALILKVNTAVVAAAESSGLPPTEFIVVGDHAPPFLEEKHRQLFSQQVVPYFRLFPN